MILSSGDINELDRVKRLNLINGITGVKPANLVGTSSKDYGHNLAIFSSVVHLGSNPALLGLIFRPTTLVPRHTYENICHSGYYTINHVHTSFIKKAHYTSAKMEKGISEFKACGLHPFIYKDFPAPYVKESYIKIGMKFKEEIPINTNGCILIIGEIQELHINDDLMDTKGYIDLDKAATAGIGGLNTYYKLQKINSFPMLDLTNYLISQHERNAIKNSPSQ